MRTFGWYVCVFWRMVRMRASLMLVPCRMQGTHSRLLDMLVLGRAPLRARSRAGRHDRAGSAGDRHMLVRGVGVKNPS